MSEQRKLIATIREQQQYKKFKAIVSVARDRLKIEADRSEALSLHAGRTSRKLFGEKQYSPKSILDASMVDLSYRARLVEMRVQCSLTISTLDAGVDAIKRYITTEFSDDLEAYKTVGQRKDFVDRIVASALDLVSEGEGLIAMLDTLIKDIDAASFQLRNAMEILKLLSETKGGKVI